MHAGKGLSWALVAHGGAGIWDPTQHDAALCGLRAAIELGKAILTRQGDAVEAVCAIVAALEDDPSFNAGTGSVLNRDGDVEMDAAVMRGSDLGFGAVLAIRRVKNPVQVARAVMQESAHCMLAGEGAVRFARAHAFADHDPITAKARSDWQRACGATLGTVGAVALDDRGRLAAATSTGGMLGKLPGRVGDSPLPGAGTYADDAAAVSATGHGELVLRSLAGKRIGDLIRAGRAPQRAVEQVLQWMQDSVGADAGFIALGRNGAIGVSHRTPFMPHAFATSAAGDPVARMRS